MFEDLRSDEIGQAICALRSMTIWTKAKFERKQDLFKLVAKENYIKWAKTRRYFWMCGGIGFSYLYRVPLNKRGHFAPFRGKLLRLVYLDSAKDYLQIGFGPVKETQLGRDLHSLAPDVLIDKFDPRRVYHLTFGGPRWKPTDTT